MFCSFKWRELPVRPGPVVPCGGGFGLARGIAVALPPGGSRVPGLLISAVGNSLSESTEVKVVAGGIISDIFRPDLKMLLQVWGILSHHLRRLACDVQHRRHVPSEAKFYC